MLNFNHFKLIYSVTLPSQENRKLQLITQYTNKLLFDLQMLKEIELDFLYNFEEEDDMSEEYTAELLNYFRPWVLYDYEDNTEEKKLLFQTIPDNEKEIGVLTGDKLCVIFDFFEYTRVDFSEGIDEYEITLVKVNNHLNQFKPNYLTTKICFFSQSSITFINNRQTTRTEWFFNLSNFTNFIVNINRELVTRNKPVKRNLFIWYLNKKNKITSDRLLNMLITKLTSQKQLNSD